MLFFPFTISYQLFIFKEKVRFCIIVCSFLFWNSYNVWLSFFVLEKKMDRSAIENSVVLLVLLLGFGGHTIDAALFASCNGKTLLRKSNDLSLAVFWPQYVYHPWPVSLLFFCNYRFYYLEWYIIEKVVMWSIN